MHKFPRQWVRATRIGALALSTCAASALAYNLLEQRNEPSDNLTPHAFTPYTLTERVRISSDSSIVKLRNVKSISSSSDTCSGHGSGQQGDEISEKGIWSIEIKQPQLMIARRYTPLPVFTNIKSALRMKEDPASLVDTTDSLDILVRREPFGEVSRYLHSLSVGARVEVRGGYLEHDIPTNVREIVFVAGGTGIAPALQVAKTLLQRKQQCKMTVLWAVKRQEECSGALVDKSKGSPFWRMFDRTPKQPISRNERNDAANLASNEIVAELEILSSKGEAINVNKTLNFSVKYFADDAGSFIHQNSIAPLLSSETGAMTGEMAGSKLLLVCGSDGFVSCIAGPKRLVNGVERQGPLGGILSLLNLRDWTVWKL